MSITKFRRVIINNSIRTAATQATAITKSYPVNETKTSNLKTWKDIPGPSSLPVIGQLLHFLPGGTFHKIPDLFDFLYNNYGPIVKIDAAFLPQMVAIYDADSIEKIFRAEEPVPLRPGLSSLLHYRKMKQEQSDTPRPLGLAISQGETWRELRSILNPIVMKTDVVNRYGNIMNDVAQDMIKRMKVVRNEKNVIPNFENELRIWSFESNATVTLGKRLNLLNLNPEVNADQTRLMNILVEIIFTMADLDYKPGLWRYYPTKSFRRAINLLEEGEGKIYKYVLQAKKELETSNKTEEQKSILEKLLDVSEHVAMINAVDFTAGGLDTVGNATLALLYLLAVNPDKQQKLRELLKTNEGLPFLKACVKEALRVKPTITMMARKTSKEYDIMGYRVPKDTVVIFGFGKLMSNETYFPRADEFIPERWIVDKDDPISYRNGHPFAYRPFGFGARSCIGQRLALMQVETITSHIVENFYVKWHAPPPKVKGTVINYFQNCNITFQDVK